MSDKILLVDDEQISSGLIRMLLEMDGFSVTICANLTQAKTALHSKLFDGLVVDCNLGNDENGLTLISLVRAGETKVATDIAIIATSGDDRKQTEATERGANMFFLKPFSPTDLSTTLTDLIHGRGL